MSEPITRKALKQQILLDLGECLETHGFPGRRRDQRLERKTGGVTQIIHLSFVDHSAANTVSVIVNLAVRHEEVEDLAFSWRTDLSKKEKKNTATIGCEFGQLQGRGQMRWELSSPDQSKLVADEICQAVSTVGLQYLENNAQLTNVRESLSSDNPKNWGQQFLSGRAVRLPVIHALLGDRELALAEFVRQLNRLRSANDLLASSYPAFVAHVCQALSLPNPLEGR